jgi:hypothetical protein
VRLRLATIAAMVLLLGACGSDDGTGPTITATLPADVSLPASVPGAVETDPPPETQPPQTDAPATQPPDVEPEEPDASTAPTDTVPPDDGDGTTWWPWVLAAVILVVAAAALFGRRRSSGPTWQVRTSALLDQIDQVTSQLAALTPEGVRVVAAADAMTLAALRGTLRDLVASAPGVEQRVSLDRLTAPLGQLHGAVDAVALSAGPSLDPAAAAVVKLAVLVHTTSASVRADASMYR